MEEDASLSCGISASSFLLYICLENQNLLEKLILTNLIKICALERVWARVSRVRLVIFSSSENRKLTFLLLRVINRIDAVTKV